MIESDLHWLAGLLEGEGYFGSPTPSAPRFPRIILNMTDEDIVNRAATLMGGNKVRRISKKKYGENWNDIFTVTVAGQTAVKLMLILQPLVGTRRQGQIQRALDSVPKSYSDPCKVCGSKIEYDATPGRRSYCSEICRKEGKRRLNLIYDRSKRNRCAHRSRI